MKPQTSYVLNVRIPVKYAEEINRIIEIENTTTSEIVRRAIEAYITIYKNNDKKEV